MLRTYAKTSILLLMSSFLTLSSLAASPEPGLQHRSDLETALQQSLCAAREVQQALTPLRLWEAGIFDTQMEASWISSDQPIEAAELAAAARDQARSLHHRGFAYGLCSPYQAWMISSPAGEPPLAKREEGLVFVNSPALAASCAFFEVDAAASSGGIPRSLLAKQKPGLQALEINTAYLSPGTLSVSCHPPNPEKRGPELWALLPIGSWDPGAIPEAQVAHDSDFSSLRTWLQKVRAGHRLPVLRADSPLLSRFAQELLQHESIRHPRPLIRSQTAELKKRRGSWLGENRVKAFSPYEMAWLLWHSPQHRRLLLHAKANAIGLQISQKRPEKLLVMVMARI